MIIIGFKVSARGHWQVQQTETKTISKQPETLLARFNLALLPAILLDRYTDYIIRPTLRQVEVSVMILQKFFL